MTCWTTSSPKTGAAENPRPRPSRSPPTRTAPTPTASATRPPLSYRPAGDPDDERAAPRPPPHRSARPASTSHRGWPTTSDRHAPPRRPARPPTTRARPDAAPRSAVLNSAHLGDIEGALGKIRVDDLEQR